MTEAKKEYGVVGLGRMGGTWPARHSRRACAWLAPHAEEPRPNSSRSGGSLADLKDRLSPPRAVFVYIPAGPAVNQVLDDLAENLEEGDVLVDGGNSPTGATRSAGTAA